MEVTGLPTNATPPLLIKGRCGVCGGYIVNYDVETNEWLNNSNTKRLQNESE